MSINTTPPVSLHEIQQNFGKAGSVGSTDRYVIDFAQRDGVTWDLLDYSGQAYGLQHEIFADGWNGGPSGGALPPDQSDKRVDGLASALDAPDGSYVRLGQDAAGKYAEVSTFQYSNDTTPGSVALNGVWYANDSGYYRVRATVETASDFSPVGEAGIFVFGYRYGYIDGDRQTYALWGNGSWPGPNKTLYADFIINVNSSYRHVVVNVNSWLPGRWGYDRAAFKVRNLQIERA